uniref:Uncharacterized protein n=1 Tax=Periophthalmus magnuspinnatus TaxID=409849 RepID=A0A3B3ZQI3_9GOBI
KCYSPMSSSPIPDTPTKQTSKPGFFRQTSERRSFKLLELRKINRDTGICGSPSRISPPSTPSSPDDTPCLSGDPYNRRRRKIPKVPLLNQFTLSQHSYNYRYSFLFFVYSYVYVIDLKIKYFCTILTTHFLDIN